MKCLTCEYLYHSTKWCFSKGKFIKIDQDWLDCVEFVDEFEQNPSHNSQEEK